MTNIAKTFTQKMTAKVDVKYNESMAEYTTFKVGGAADIIVFPKNLDELLEVLGICRGEQLPYFVLGCGSNVLIKDDGLRGVVISFKRLSDTKQLEESKIEAQGGVFMRELSLFAYSLGLSGLEFAHGIPGSVGGGVYMNAGAYDGEISKTLSKATLIDKSGRVFLADNEQMEFGYRTSLAQKEDCIVYSATFELEAKNKNEIYAKMEELYTKRTSKQPLEYPSAGSTFKRPPGHFAGKLIMDAGLGGHSIGGAMVSSKHCGFVINTGSATCADILSLIEHIQQEIWRQFGVKLEREVKILE